MAKLRQYTRVFEKGSHNASYFLEDFEEAHIRIILSRFHGENMYLERTHTIKKEAIQAVTGYFSTGEVPELRKISKDTVFNLISSTSDGCSFSVNNIKDPAVKLVAMVIGYRVFYSSRLNSVPSATVHTTHGMIVDNADYDLCEAIRRQLFFNLQSIKKDSSLKFKYGQLLVDLFFYFQNFLPGIGDIEWSKDSPVSAQIKNSIKAIKNTFHASLNRYFNEFQKKMSMRMRLPEEVIKHFEKDIIFPITTNFCLMQAIEPREEEMEDMSYEVNHDLLVGYVNTLLTSSIDKKKAKLDIVAVQEASVQTSTTPVKSTRGKNKKSDEASPTTKSTRVTRSVLTKKEPEPKVYTKKETKKRGRKLILQPNSEGTDSDEEPKKVKATDRISKKVKVVPKATTPIDIAAYKPDTHFERTMKTLGRNRFDNVKEYFDSFTEDEKEQVIQQVITHLCHYSRFPHDLEKVISISLYNILLDKWEDSIKLEKEIIDEIFVQYFPNLSTDGISALVDQYKAHFSFKARRLKLLNGKRAIVETETHQIACGIKKMEELIHSSKNKDKEEIVDDVNRPEMDEEDIIQPDEVYPLKKKDDSIILVDDDVQNTVDLSGDNVAPDMEPPAITNV